MAVSRRCPLALKPFAPGEDVAKAYPWALQLANRNMAMSPPWTASGVAFGDTLLAEEELGRGGSKCAGDEAGVDLVRDTQRILRTVYLCGSTYITFAPLRLNLGNYILDSHRKPGIITT